MGEPGTLFVPASDLMLAPDVVGTYRNLAWQQHLLFEDACAVWDTLAREHRDCVHDDVVSGMSQFHAFEFRCPVAAAVLHAYGMFGVSAEALRGWHMRLSDVHALYGLNVRFDTPDWAVPALVREAGRRYLLKP